MTTGAGLIDLTPFGKLELYGPDARRLLDHISANELPTADGRTCITHMLTERGRVYAELTVTRLSADRYFCMTGSGSEVHDQRWIEEARRRDGGYAVDVDNVTERWACVGIAGPASRRVLQRVTETDLSPAAFRFLDARVIKIAGVKTRALRISYTGELGWELYTPAEDLPIVYEALLDAGAADGDDVFGDFGTYAMNSLRLEKGFRAWGAEMNVDTDPLEAGLGAFVRLDKAADFVGKTALRRIKRDGGPKRRLVLLTVDAADVDAVGNETVWSGERVVGNTTSGAYGYTVDRSLAFAYLPVELATPGTRVDVELMGDRRPAVVERGAPVKIDSVRERQRAKGGLA